MTRNPNRTRITPGLVDLGLFAGTTGYAIWLWAYRKRPRPHTTWIKVVIGDLMCIAGSAGRSYGTGLPYNVGHVVWSFVVGGTPIVIGELAQSLERRVEARESEEHDADPAPPGWE